jgi:NAD(P)-dependent dehydrogenase (short-subunit alcohol dehydrogenase family)
MAAYRVKVAILDFNENIVQAMADEFGGIFFKIYVTSNEQVETGFSLARTVDRQQCILLNCPGAASAFKTAMHNRKTDVLQHFSMDDFERIIHINLIDTFRCIARLLRAC